MNPETIMVRVVKRVKEALDIDSFELADCSGGALPSSTPGAHLDVHLPSGLTRQYSLCDSASTPDRYRIAVLRDPTGRGGSVDMHDLVKVGDTLRIGAPRNHFPLVPSASRSLLFAGGIGITPILSMAQHLTSHGQEFELHYCARSADRMAFRDLLMTTALAHKTCLYFDDQGEDQRIDISQALALPREGVHVYVCGPRGFIDAVLQTAQANGWPGSQLHSESFSGNPAITRGAPFEVQLARSGRVISVSSEETVIQALARSGVDVPTSCEQGICGTCLLRVCAGVPDHRDMFLTPAEHLGNEWLIPCCSRSKTSTLVLDL